MKPVEAKSTEVDRFRLELVNVIEILCEQVNLAEFIDRNVLV